MTAFDRISSAFSLTGSSLMSVAKILLQSGHCSIKSERRDEPVIIMGNGPSLRDAIDHNLDALRRYPTLAVNWAGNTEEFRLVKPRYYVLADPFFFVNVTEGLVDRLVKNLNSIDLPLTLFVPANKRAVAQVMFTNPKIAIETFNCVGVEGFSWLENMAYRYGWGMPRPRNVMIPSIMIALALGYKEIYLVGADHSWSQTLSVDEENRVISVQPHFYKDEAADRNVIAVHQKYKLHEIIYSLYVAFRAYHQIARYAGVVGAKIYNSTPGSFIDAFPRKSLPSD